MEYQIKSWPINDILSKQYRKGRYNRLDIFVRYMCCEEYYKSGKTKGKAWKIYKKMQFARNKLTPSYTKRRIGEFVTLMESIRKDGFRYDIKGLRLDRDLELVNGSHRLAVCLYHKITEVGIKYPADSKKVRKPYSAKWFYKNGFSKRTIKMIHDKRLEMFEKVGLKDEETSLGSRSWL